MQEHDENEDPSVLQSVRDLQRSVQHAQSGSAEQQLEALQDCSALLVQVLQQQQRHEQPGSPAASASTPSPLDTPASFSSSQDEAAGLQLQLLSTIHHTFAFKSPDSQPRAAGARRARGVRKHAAGRPAVDAPGAEADALSPSTSASASPGVSSPAGSTKRHKRRATSNLHDHRAAQRQPDEREPGQQQPQEPLPLVTPPRATQQRPAPLPLSPPASSPKQQHAAARSDATSHQTRHQQQQLQHTPPGHPATDDAQPASPLALALALASAAPPQQRQQQHQQQVAELLDFHEVLLAQQLQLREHSSALQAALADMESIQVGRPPGRRRAGPAGAAGAAIPAAPRACCCCCCCREPPPGFDAWLAAPDFDGPPAPRRRRTLSSWRSCRSWR
jgi:hypothetical protein